MEPFLLLREQSWLIPFALLGTLIILLINNYRWLILMRSQGILSTHSQSLRLSFIGLFFNLAMPGSVGGDVLKAYYITREHPNQKFTAATSVIVDRIVGLYSVILIACVAVLMQWHKVASSSKLKGLSLFIFAMAFGFSALFAIGFSRRIKAHGLTEKIFTKIPGGALAKKLYEAIHSFRNSQKTVLISILLTLVAQIQLIASLFIVGQYLHFEPRLETFLFVFPVGFMATAIPISPAGIGVGQAVFMSLFSLFDGYSNSMGPTLITINQMCFAVLGLVGAALYFIQKSHDANE
jgi:uncharacterized protein (TIRG00374 family)